MKRIFYVICLLLCIGVLTACGEEEKTLPLSVSMTADVEYMIVNKSSLDQKLNIESVTLSKEEVVYTIGEDFIDDVDSIKAIVDIDSLTAVGVGTYNLDDLELVAYNDKGRVVEDIDIKGDIDAEIVISSFSKVVPVKVVPIGELASGKAISSIQINGKETQEVTIYGRKQDLINVNYVEAVIDVTGLGNNGDVSNLVTLAKPSGVKTMSDNSMKVDLKFGVSSTRNVSLNLSKFIGLSDKLNLDSLSSNVVEVQLLGTEDVMNSVDTNTIVAYLDLSDLKVGTHEVEVRVEGLDQRIQYVVTKRVTAVLSDK